MLWISTSVTSYPWRVTAIEDEAVEHSRGVGAFTPEEEREPLVVGLVQRDDLGIEGAPGGIVRNPAQVSVAGIRLTPAEACTLAQLLTSAAAMITGPIRRDRWSRNGGYGLAQLQIGLHEAQHRSA